MVFIVEFTHCWVEGQLPWTTVEVRLGLWQTVRLVQCQMDDYEIIVKALLINVVLQVYTDIVQVLNLIAPC